MGFIHLGLFRRRTSVQSQALYLVCVHEDCLEEYSPKISNSYFCMVRFGVIFKCQVFFKCKGFPRGSVVKTTPASAGDTGLLPGLGRSHMPWSNETRAPQPLSPCAAPQLLRLACPRACAPQQKDPLQREAGAPQLGSGPCSPDREKSPCSSETQCSQQ